MSYVYTLCQVQGETLARVGTGLKGPFGWAHSHGTRNHDTVVQTTGGDFCLVLLAFSLHINLQVEEPLVYCKNLSPALATGTICPSMQLPVLKDNQGPNQASSYKVLRARDIKKTWTLVSVMVAEDQVPTFYAVNT